MAAVFRTGDGAAHVIEDTARIGLHTIPPLDERLYAIRDAQTAFFKAHTGISDDGELKAHIIRVQREAYKVAARFLLVSAIRVFADYWWWCCAQLSPYPCVRCGEPETI